MSDSATLRPEETGLPRYAEWAPTVFDHKGAYLRCTCAVADGTEWAHEEDCDDRQEWLVCPVSQTRDSGPLDQSNFATLLGMLGDESATVEVHRFGHWGPGWIEIILVDPRDYDRMCVAAEAYRALQDYPVLAEDDYSEREWEAAQETWQYCYGLAERVNLCREAGISVFAARSEGIPRDDSGHIFDRCRPEG